MTSPSETDLLPWHALLAPLPPEAAPRRQPVGSPEILAQPHGAAIAGWEQLTIDLSAGAAGLRNVLVVLDANGQVISANDSVLYCGALTAQAPGAVSEFHHESIGGRFEVDGSFRGTRWKSVTLETEGREQPETTSTPSEPSGADVAALRVLVADVMHRAGLRD